MSWKQRGKRKEGKVCLPVTDLNGKREGESEKKFRNQFPPKFGCVPIPRCRKGARDGDGDGEAEGGWEREELGVGERESEVFFVQESRAGDCRKALIERLAAAICILIKI